MNEDIALRIQVMDGTFVEIEVSRLDGVLSRMRGLIGRPELPPSCGVMLRGKQVHTFGMRHSIDVVHVGPDGTVLNVMNLRPRRISPILKKARWVLELKSGEAKRLGIRTGSIVLHENERS